MGWIVALSVIGVLIAMFIFARALVIWRRKRAGKEVKRPRKIRLKRKKEEKQLRNQNGKLDTKGSYCDVVDKYLYRKELKLFVLISKILPKGYIVFPKVGVDTILEPVGSHTLYNSIRDRYVDLVIFNLETMKPRVVIDIFDGSIGDEQLETETPEVIEALKSAELPLISIKVQTSYDQEELKDQIMAILEPKPDEEESEPENINS